MIISSKKILELNKTHNLIENLCERELNPEGVGLDIRVGEVYKIKGKGYLGVEERKTPDIEKIADFKKDKKILLNPGEFILVKTIEKINLPSEKILIDNSAFLLMIQAYPRTTLHRSGIDFRGTKVDPGYSGELIFSLANIGNAVFELELGARIANLVFSTVYGDLSRSYEGQWKGGRVAAGSVERQI